jgi:N-acetylglutamate synthase-like GNAT family acetyltransferase
MPQYHIRQFTLAEHEELIAAHLALLGAVSRKIQRTANFVINREHKERRRSTEEIKHNKIKIKPREIVEIYAKPNKNKTEQKKVKKVAGE